MMKKIIFLLAMLAGVAASATVTVTPLSVNYNTKTVTFRVVYSAAANNRAWLWIDLCPVSGVTPSTFQTAVISAVSATGGSWDNTSLNGRGFYVTTNPSTVTATLDNAPAGKFNWCAYGSDFPPNAVENGSSYTLKGSPPFILTTSSGTVEVSAKTYTGATITALTDATGCPGVLCSKNNETMGLLGCCAGTTNCNNTCKTNGTYTQNNGACTGGCKTAYVQQYDQCGTLINDKHSTYTNNSCTTPNYTTNDGACTGSCNIAYVRLRDACGTVINSTYSTYTNTSCTSGCTPPCPACRYLWYVKTYTDSSAVCSTYCSSNGYSCSDLGTDGGVWTCWCCNY
jgi:hypothetical protein